MSTTLVRGIAAATGSALALSLALAPSAQAAPIPAPAGADPAPAARAAAYLAAQPQPNNIIKTYFEFPPGTFDSYDDYGLTIDAGYALDAVGGNTAKVTAMTTALEANIGNYAFGGGSRAKLSSFLLSQGRTSAAVNNLVTDLATHIEDDTPNTGRLTDPDDPMTPWDDDFNSPLTQAYAVSALNNAGSPLAGSVLTFHLAQQCTAGFFRTSFSAKDAVDQSCDAAVGPTPSVDTTGLTVILLQDQKSKPVVSAAITKALDWLVSQQAANGSFSSGNANATGLAGWALGVSGRTAAAAKAAGWLRAHQLANAGACTPYAAKDNGAVARRPRASPTPPPHPTDDVENSVTTRATSQALPALLWAPGGADAGATTLTGPTGFVPAGSVQNVAALRSPGNTLCVTKGGTPTRVVLDAAGAATVPVTLGAETSTVTVSTVDAGGETDSLSIHGLASTTLKVDAEEGLGRQGHRPRGEGGSGWQRARR